ncbi:MAG: hypothetical protein HKL98_11315 [Burkholderiales bacterium]|nr:hypothetical protein [Burkholderiales bacterium]
MDEFTRSATLADLKLLISSLNENKADYLLIGGYALYTHGYHRATVDIDILVPANRKAGEAIKKALMVLPDRAAADIDPEWFEEGETFRLADEFVVDIMMNACGETFETLSRYAETVELEGIPVRTVSLEGLLRTKQTVRDKDVSDRIILERAMEVFKRETGKSKEREDDHDPGDDFGL